ncbi:MAG: YfiH family protein [Candidatus Endobugula sp.]|jgi:YfiH family protein
MHNIHYLDWPAPNNVNACYTLRMGGQSLAPYSSFNLGDHVGDTDTSVIANRQQLAHAIGQRQIPWLQQVHSTKVIELPLIRPFTKSDWQADACFSRQTGQVCCIMTADCLPVFFCDPQGHQVAIAHAGWRGLLDGVLENTLAHFDDGQQVMAYLGPAISQQAFIVGDEVRVAFVQKNPSFAQYFIPSIEPSKWMGDLYGLARATLNHEGVSAIYGAKHCTYSEPDFFFSYRREGVTGRMANLIWLD